MNVNLLIYFFVFLSLFNDAGCFGDKAVGWGLILVWDK
jgi:hypothetical protein